MTLLLGISLINKPLNFLGRFYNNNLLSEAVRDIKSQLKVGKLVKIICFLHPTILCDEGKPDIISESCCLK